MKIIHLENLKKAQTSIKSIIKEKPKDVEVILTINKNQKIKTNKIKDNENIKNLEKIMGENGLKKKLKKGNIMITKKDFNIDKIRNIVKELKKIFKILENLEFQTPKFENQVGPPTKTNEYSDKYKNNFKDMIIGKLDSLIKFYDNYDSLKKITKKNVE